MKKMKYLLLGFATLAFVACGGPAETPAVEEETTDVEVVEGSEIDVVEGAEITDEVTEEAAE